MNPDVITILQDKKPIPHEIMCTIQRIGVPTGSTVFGGADPSTADDLDYLIPPNDDGITFAELWEYFAYASDYQGEGFQSCYVKFREKIINLILIYEEKDFKQWQKATEICFEMYHSSEKLKALLKEKKNRVQIFEVLKSLDYK